MIRRGRVSPPSEDRSSDVFSTAFWSYVHNDDVSLHGKIEQLREDLCRVYSVVTGNGLKIFIDRHDVGWGQQWESVLGAGIEQASFMMPIVTANYFNSEHCRSEILDFSSRCRARGLRDDLILPIVLTGLDLISAESDDEVAKIIAGTQLEDFSEIWPLERGGERWMLAVLRMVHKFIEAETRAVDKLSLGVVRGHRDPDSPDDSDGDEDLLEPGVAEIVADLAPALEDAVAALGQAVAALKNLAVVIRSDSIPSESGSGRFQRQLLAAAATISVPAREFESAAASALEKVSRADTLITSLRQNLDGMHDREFATGALHSLTESFGDFSGVRDVEHGIEPLLAQIADVERMSAVLKRELRPARRGFRFIRDAARLVVGWRPDEPAG